MILIYQFSLLQGKYHGKDTCPIHNDSHPATLSPGYISQSLQLGSPHKRLVTFMKNSIAKGYKISHKITCLYFDFFSILVV